VKECKPLPLVQRHARLVHELLQLGERLDVAAQVDFESKT